MREDDPGKIKEVEGERGVGMEDMMGVAESGTIEVISCFGVGELKKKKKKKKKIIKIKKKVIKIKTP